MSGIFRMAVLAIMLCAAPLPTQPLRAQPSDPYYDQSARDFLKMEAEVRLFLQVMLITAGHLVTVPTLNYSRSIHAAIQDFQRERGEAATGLLTSAQIEHLGRLNREVMDGWGLRSVPHPTHGRLLWVPFGLGLTAERTATGALMRDSRNRVRIAFNALPDRDVRGHYEALLREMTGSGDTIVYRLLRKDFFVISASQRGYTRYVRYHRDDTGLLGFEMSYFGEEGPVYGPRLVTLISASFGAAMSGAAFISVPRVRYPWERDEPPAANPPVASAPSPTPAPAATPPAAKPPAEQSGKAKFQTGTGFFVSMAGHLVTNAHVIEGCSVIAVRDDDGGVRPARVLARDPSNDLALLQAVDAAVSPRPAAPLALRTGIRLGEGVAAFGFPHSDVLATTGNFTLGNVTALAGLRDDSRYLQFSAPIQAGNSGGPLLDASGQVVGVVTSKLNDLAMMVRRGELPQNVNFALKASVAASFLEAQRVPFETKAEAAKLEPADLADKAKRASVFIRCE